MSQVARLFHICRRLQDGAVVTATSLAKELEVSRATVFRDIALLRDQLHAPLLWDTEAETFKLERSSGRDHRFMVPGLWMGAHELYGMLTVLNIAAAVDPGVAKPLYREFRRLLKHVASAQRIKVHGLDRKVIVEIPPPGDAAQEAMLVIGPALVLDLRVKIHAEGLSNPDGLLITPRRLRLRPDGWWLDYTSVDDEVPLSLPVANIQRAESLPDQVGDSYELGTVDAD